MSKTIYIEKALKEGKAYTSEEVKKWLICKCIKWSEKIRLSSKQANFFALTILLKIYIFLAIFCQFWPNPTLRNSSPEEVVKYRFIKQIIKKFLANLGFDPKYLLNIKQQMRKRD